MDTNRHWVGTWATAPAPSEAGVGFNNHTVRMNPRVSIGGGTLRVRVSNAYGNGKLAIGAAYVGIRDKGPADIDFIVVGTTTPDMMFPSTACLIQHKIGARHAWGFDLSAACSAFTSAHSGWLRSMTSGRSPLAAGRPFSSAIGWCFLPPGPAASKKLCQCGCQDPAASRVAPKPNCSNTFRSKFVTKWNGR